MSYVMLTNKVHVLNLCFNSILLVFYMFRTSYIHLQEDYIVHAALYVMFFMHLCKQSSRLEDVHVQYSLPDDEHKMFETCRRQEEFN